MWQLGIVTGKAVDAVEILWVPTEYPGPQRYSSGYPFWLYVQMVQQKS